MNLKVKNIYFICLFFSFSVLLFLFFIFNVFNVTDKEKLNNKVNDVDINPVAYNVGSEKLLIPNVYSKERPSNIIVKSNENEINKTESVYWKKIKNQYGDDLAALRDAMVNGDVDGLAIFNALKNSDSADDKSWFIDVMRNYDDEVLFENILKEDCCEGDSLSALVFRFSIEQFNTAATNALMNSHDYQLSENQQDKILYLMGGATEYTAGKEINSTVVGWLEDKIFAQSSQSDISTVMAYFRAAQGNPQLSQKAENYLVDLFTDSNRLLRGNIRIEDHFKNTQPSKNLVNKIESILSSDQLSTENKFALHEVYNYWVSLETDSKP